jgi:hypothetical protein
MGHVVGRCLVVILAVLILAAGCASSASLTQTPTSTPAPSTTVGQPADDRARIIAVESPKVLVHRTWVGGAISIDPNPVPVTRVRDLTIDSPGVGTVKGQRLG